jgi:exosortase/archaeosortase family protein
VTSAAIATPARPTKYLNRVLAVLIAGAGVVLLVTEAHIRLFEARVAAEIMRLTSIGGHAQAVGSSVVFPHQQHWIGFTIATSCTAALLIAPFFLIGAGLVLTGRIPIRSALIALVAITVIVWFVNQLRLLLIGASMQLWGLKSGYSRSHVLAGGVVSTIGVAIGIAVFLALVLHNQTVRRNPES